MKWDVLKKQLEDALDAKVNIETLVEDTSAKASNSFLLEHDDQGATVLLIESEKLTRTERKLIDLAIDAFRQNRADSNGFSNRDVVRSALRSWLFERLDRGTTSEALPSSLKSQRMLQENVIPILLSVDTMDLDKAADIELEKLLETFFEADLLLIPLLEKEWLILAPEDVLQASSEENDRTQESSATKETLESFGLGLYEMISSEWRGGSHIAVDYPLVPADHLLPSLARLRETLAIGRQFRTGSHIHFTWQLQLEKLLTSVPEVEQKWFVEYVLNNLNQRMDSETILTLEHFFELDCNVSETAKQLYIHRNTLLYRLDKFKQETGFDVRLFSDAVLVKIALVLYKVTKRN